MFKVKNVKFITKTKDFCVFFDRSYKTFLDNGYKIDKALFKVYKD